uniref:Putative salivary lipocalin n=1 Tax=Ixodes ricinus TaxID=34613 RepID=A0A0K8RHP1_IXORI
MYIFVFTAFVVLGCSFGETKDQKCFPKGIEHLLLHPPNAWKLLEELKDTFFLVYYSKDLDVSNTFPCLAVRKSTLNKESKSGRCVYKYASNTSVTLTGTKEVKTKTKDGAYKHPNMFSVQYHEGDNYIWHDIELLYTDYMYCAVLKSNFFGIQVWVSKTHLENVREIPWICSLVYDLATDKPRRVLYDWKECPLRIKKNKQMSLDCFRCLPPCWFTSRY